jgi:hypothetical protein
MGTSDDLRARIGPLGTWSNFDGLDAVGVKAFAAEVEALGFGALWVNETVGREPFALLGALAGSTSRLTLGLGIASIYADAAAATATRARSPSSAAAVRDGARCVTARQSASRCSTRRR